MSLKQGFVIIGIVLVLLDEETMPDQWREAWGRANANAW